MSETARDARSATPDTTSLERWLAAVFPPVDPRRLAAVRILIAGFSTLYLLLRASHLTDFSSFAPRSFRPVGPVALLDAPLPPSAVLFVYAVALASGIALVLGYRHRVTGPLHALTLLWVLSYRNSWGMIFHTENLLVLHALVLAIAPAADVWSLDARGTAAPHVRYSWPLRALCWVVVLSYLIAGFAKLRAAGLSWGLGEELRAHVAFDALRKLELGSTHSPLGAWMVPHAWLFPPLAGVTLAFELGAPLAMLGGRWARIWCWTAWGFHAGVLLTMFIVFPYPLLGIAFAPFFAVERGFERWFWPVLARFRARFTS